MSAHSESRPVPDLSPESVRGALAASRGMVPAVSPRMHRRDERGQIIPRAGGPPPGRTAAQAAVLVLLYPRHGELHVAFTRRTDHLAHHRGQISFPGGAVEPEDASFLDTALREAQEEVGIGTRDLQVWEELEPVYVPPSNYLVHPFVVYAGRRPDFHPDPNEVAELLEVPLSSLMRPESFVLEPREMDGQRFLEPLFRYQSHRIWGATAIVLDQLLERIKIGQRRNKDSRQ